MDNREYYNGIWEEMLDEIATRKLSGNSSKQFLEEFEESLAPLHESEYTEITDDMVTVIELMRNLFQKCK